MKRLSRPWQRPWLAIAAGLAILSGCANRVTTPGLRNDLIVQTTVSGKISQDPGVRYMFVMNATPVPDGPKLFGPWVYVMPQLGWDFPFFLGADTPGASTSLANQTPPVILEPSIWTDAFVLYNVAGTERVDHWIRTNVTGTETQQSIQRAPNPLTQGVDWLLTSSMGSAGATDTWQLNLPLSTYNLANMTSVNANFVIQQIPPPNANYQTPGIGYTGPYGEGWIIDQWNQAPNVFVTLSLDPNRGIVNQTSPHAGTPVYGSQNIPVGVTPDDVTLKAYSTQVKQF